MIKIGTKVKIIHCATEPINSNFEEIKYAKKYVGKIGKVVKYNKEYIDINEEYCVECGGDAWNYSEKYLEVVN